MTLSTLHLHTWQAVEDLRDGRAHAAVHAHVRLERLAHAVGIDGRLKGVDGRLTPLRSRYNGTRYTIHCTLHDIVYLAHGIGAGERIRGPGEHLGSRFCTKDRISEGTTRASLLY